MHNSNKKSLTVSNTEQVSQIRKEKQRETCFLDKGGVMRSYHEIRQTTRYLANFISKMPHNLGMLGLGNHATLVILPFLF